MPSPEPLGLRSGEVVVAPYDERWASLFEVASSELAEALGSEAVAIHHVGSTSVPGLCAKPILDLLITVANFERARELAPRLESLGYAYRPNEDIPDRHFFRRFNGGLRTHHLSLAEPVSYHHIATIAFRDALREDPHLRTRYADLKMALAQRYPYNRPAYIDGKSDFIREVLAED